MSNIRYRLYLDESGDHSSSDQETLGKRYLGLVGAAFQQSEHYSAFSSSLDEFRKSIFGQDPPVLHREEIVSSSGEFGILKDPEARTRFDQGLLRVFEASRCKIVAVVIDKHQHQQAGYRSLTHPYHYCLHAMLERYCGYLDLCKAQGDVMAESRGRFEDMALKDEYDRIYRKGTRFLKAEVAQRVLTSKEIKIKPKQAGIHGLQLADILAHPLTRDVLFDYQRITQRGGGWFCSQLAEVAKGKYNRQVYNGRIKGYGRVILS